MWARIPSIIKGMTLVNGQAAGRQLTPLGRLTARDEDDDLPQPFHLWIRELPDDSGILGADREFT